MTTAAVRTLPLPEHNVAGNIVAGNIVAGNTAAGHTGSERVGSERRGSEGDVPDKRIVPDSVLG